MAAGGKLPMCTLMWVLVQTLRSLETLESIRHYFRPGRAFGSTQNPGLIGYETR
jgi:hypothetical protein